MISRSTRNLFIFVAKRAGASPAEHAGVIVIVAGADRVERIEALELVGGDFELGARADEIGAAHPAGRLAAGIEEQAPVGVAGAALQPHFGALGQRADGLVAGAGAG